MRKELVRRKMIEIVKMTEAHVPQVAAMEKELFSEGWSENSVRGELTNDLALWLVALDGDTVAGYVGSQTVLDEADMLNLAVQPDYRRRGIAKRLCRALMGNLNAHCLTLEVRVSNEPAIRLYHSLGFQQVGRRKNYYQKPKEDALILRKEWTDEYSSRGILV